MFKQPPSSYPLASKISLGAFNPPYSVLYYLLGFQLIKHFLQYFNSIFELSLHFVKLLL